MDWNAIKTEYVTTDTSYRKLSEKYGITVTQISNVARKEGWVTDKQQFLKKSYTKTLNAIASKTAKRATRLVTLSDKILNKLEKFVDVMDENDLSAYRQVTSALKDIKEIQMIKSEQDIIEQQARIDKIRRDVDSDNEPTKVIVTIDGVKDAWNE